MATVFSLLTRFPLLFLKGAGITLFMAATTVVLGTILATGICFLRMSRWKVLRFISSAYVEIIRGTPMLLQITLAVFVLPDLIGIELSNLYSIIFALILNSAAYVSEIIRAGINAVDKGQAEAARSLGLPATTTMQHIILPQAIKNILPALGNEFIMIIKDSSLGSTLFVGELMTVQATIKGSMFLVVEPLIAVGIIYFIMTFTLSKCVEAFERRLSKGD